MKHLFELGQVVTTKTIQELLERDQIMDIITKHITGDFGDLVQEDIDMNHAAIKDGDRILSAYNVNDQKVYIITEWDRSYTTVLFAHEY